MLDEIVQRYTIEVVMNRTKISRKNLQKLLDGDFSGLTRPQAMGFVKILEREFDADLSELKARLESYFEESGASQEDQPVFIAPQSGAEARGSNLKWPVAIVVALLAMGGYYFYDWKESPRSVQTVSTSQSTRAQNEVQSPKEAETETEELEEVVDETTVESSVQETTLQEPSEEENATSAATETNQSASRSEPKEPAVVYEPVHLAPKMKLWYGLIDLENGKKRSAIAVGPVDIDANGKKLLLTGHGRFEISDGEGNLIKLDDIHKHYFLIDKGEVQEIDKKRFKELNGGRVW